ncbi:MAG: hypothetical protein LBC28_01795, partial [Oscillospiraceae bacterium]|jgi:ABC-type glycerol-3-phosphate transport system substrate-binding protein|nr:hypothetical protein [Oscillospiraceae bacterium]
MTAEEALMMLVEADADSLIDFKNGECHFNSEEFIRLLEFSKLLPNTQTMFPDDGGSLEEQMARGQAILDSHIAVRDGKTLAADWYVNGFLDAQGISRAYGGDIVFVGRPKTEGNGSSFSASNMFFMSSRSRHKDGAWEFLRYLLSYETQSAENYLTTYSPGFPTNKAAFDDLITLVMTPKYETDDTGERIEVPLYSEATMLESTDVYAASRDEIDQIIGLIASAEGLARRDNFINIIVTEEAAPFFAGQKSAEEAAKIIQSRVSLYVAERS